MANHANPFSIRPRYDELALVHALDERIFANQQWQDGVIPHSSTNSQQQQTQFFNWVNQLKQQRGRDGKPLFTIPALLSSQDQEWRDLDKQNFATWLGICVAGVATYLVVLTIVGFKWRDLKH